MALNLEPEWRHNGPSLTTGYEPRWRRARQPEAGRPDLTPVPSAPHHDEQPPRRNRRNDQG
jgi:hypothetical protein